MEQLPLETNTARRFRMEDGALCARFGPVPLPAAISGLSFQSDLPGPTRFAIARSGHAEIQAEVPLVAERRLCEKLLDAAIDDGLAGRSAARKSDDPQNAPMSDPEIESALSQLPWGFRQRDTGRYQIDAAPAPSHAMRVMLELKGAALCASTATSLRGCPPDVHHALCCFALESNSRLRLARINVAATEEGVDIAWDSLLPAALASAGAISACVEAVVYAQMLTRQSFSVLANPRVAGAYLAQRPPAPAKDRSGHAAPGRGLDPAKRAVPVTAPGATSTRQSVAVEQPL